MNRSIKHLIEITIAFVTILFLLAITFFTWRFVSNIHPIPKSNPATPNTNNPASNPNVDPGASLGNKMAPNFTLTNQFGKSISLKNYRGKIVVLTFIDSKCTTVCPLTAVVLKNLMYDLGPYRKNVQLVAVNANPIATKVKDVYDWSSSHGMLHEWQYLTGPTDSLQNVWKNYYVSSQILHGNLVEHIAAVFVIDAKGHEKWLYLNSTDPQASTISAQVQEIENHIAPLLPGHVSPSQFAPARQLEYLPSSLGPSSAVDRAFTLPTLFPNKSGLPTTRNISIGHTGHSTLLEFFATWCPDCQMETPTLQKYAQWTKRHPTWPTLFAVDLRQSEPSTLHVKQYMVTNHLQYPVALDATGSVSDLYGITGIPTQVLVSGTGHILWYHQGLISFSNLTSNLQANMSKGLSK
ncbi:redoxin domain-containing protein [Ferroacidibacillus organovorans]|uniref:Thioredoxin domain-containing protein n=1 Tax=Ferroacidibacillus organovorans TaxID=1765683 RepID=A0A101XTI0_9BACL|nr:redoxin domain-containing protein [Ferroacidibacillus organovorans]KUO97253.1 hypothetical protein ATW55_11710 [Ferroacidibacillus organovorans]